MNDAPATLGVARLSAAYQSGALTPSALLDDVYRRVDARGHSPIWIELVPRERAQAALALASESKARGETLPLFGIPFAIKDNIDLAGASTSAGCPAFSRIAGESAAAVELLTRAGAIAIGKTNLDQFATGLVGVRSPYGACACAFDARYIAGGSSSGSALAVAHGLVSFALGTDTAGSGRVPAAFNNLIGLKPTRGLVSTRGVVPACRSLDCVSVFAASVADASQVLDVLAAFDELDPFSRAAREGLETVRRVGVPSELEFHGNREYERLFRVSVERAAGLGLELVPVDFQPFLAAARLLYGGPWVAERYAAVGEFIAAHPDATHPVVREIILGGRATSGAEVFSGQYRLAELARATEPTWQTVDALLLPTAATHYTLAEVERDPIELNSRLGRYTNFVNLLDLAALALPAGFTREGLPFGVTLVGPAFSDRALAALGARFERNAALSQHTEPT